MENKHLLIDQNNLFIIGTSIFIVGVVVGSVISACLTYHLNSISKADEKLQAYEEYYRCTETLLDSLDGTHNLDLMDTDLATDYGADYLHAKSIVDSLSMK